MLSLKNYFWDKPTDRASVVSTLERMCVNPMQDKVNTICGMALEVEAEFNEAVTDTGKANAGSKALIKLRGELLRLYQMQKELAAAAQSNAETQLTADLLTNLEAISKKAHEVVGFTYAPLDQLAALT